MGVNDSTERFCKVECLSCDKSLSSQRGWPWLIRLTLLCYALITTETTRLKLHFISSAYSFNVGVNIIA